MVPGVQITSLDTVLLYCRVQRIRRPFFFWVGSFFDKKDDKPLVRDLISILAVFYLYKVMEFIPMDLYHLCTVVNICLMSIV